MEKTTSLTRALAWIEKRRIQIHQELDKVLRPSERWALKKEMRQLDRSSRNLVSNVRK